MTTEQRKAPTSLSPSEFLEFEESAFERHEYLGGSVFMLPGSTVLHNRIAANIYVNLIAAVEQHPDCTLLMSQVKLQAAADIIYYPDLMIICDPTDLDPLIKRRPSLVVEVLSDTTRMTDLREKLFAYHQIESLDAYLIVEQDERKVYRHWRDDERLWWSDTVSERGSIPIPRLGIELSLDDIYRKLPNPAPS